jgi:protein TonB
MAIAFNLAAIYLLLGTPIADLLKPKPTEAVAPVAILPTPTPEPLAPVVSEESIKEVKKIITPVVKKSKPKAKVIAKIEKSSTASEKDEEEPAASKEKIAGVMSRDDDEGETEATAKEATPAMPEPLEQTEIATQLSAPAAIEAKAAQETEAPPTEAPRSYLQLKQESGNPAPKYPFAARQMGQEGNVELTYFVTETGEVKDLRVSKSSGFPDLDREAVRAISTYKYSPGQSGWTKHPVQFSLKDSST